MTDLAERPVPGSGDLGEERSRSRRSPQLSATPLREGEDRRVLVEPPPVDSWAAALRSDAGDARLSFDGDVEVESGVQVSEESVMVAAFEEDGLDGEVLRSLLDATTAAVALRRELSWLLDTLLPGRAEIVSGGDLSEVRRIVGEFDGVLERLAPV